MKFAPARVLALAFAALLAAFAATPALAQEEGVPVVVDEPVVQVNNDVIMLSQLKRENQAFKEVLVNQRGLKPDEADRQIAERQGEIIFNLINESLIMQKGKDLPRLAEEVEADVNREILRVANAQGIKTIEELETVLRAQGQSLAEIRETLRTQYMRQAVLRNEVDAKVYFGLGNDELKKYYEANRDKFKSVTLSEIFLSLAGRTEAEVLARARQLVAQARGGADFGELAVKNSEREANGVRIAEKTRGRVEEDGKPRWFQITDLQGNLADAVRNLPAGGVSDPVKTDEGYMILRVNERSDDFNENQVRIAIVQERGEKERAEYVRKLRQEAYIKAADNYKDLVQPLLEKDARSSPAKKTASAGKEKK